MNSKLKKIVLIILVFLSGIIFGINSPSVFSVNQNYQPEEINVSLSLFFGLMFGIKLLFFKGDKQ